LPSEFLSVAEFQVRCLKQQQVIDRLATEIAQLEQLLSNLHLRNTGTPLNVNVQQAFAAIPTLKRFDHKNGDTSENIKSFRESRKDYCIALHRSQNINWNVKKSLICV
jgi:hypothetical protein